MDQIILVSGTGPIESWDVLRVWHISQRDEAEAWLRDYERTVEMDGLVLGGVMLAECMERYGTPIMTEHNFEDFDDF